MTDEALRKLFKVDKRRTFGPASAKPFTPDPVMGFEHRAEIKDDGKPTTFRWHFPRGTLKPRMSALELAEFVLPHMPAVLGLFAGHPRIQAEFSAILARLANGASVDELVPWVRSVCRQADDDTIVMNLFDQTEQPGPTFFVGAS